MDGFLNGRRKIFTSANEITRENVLQETNKALAVHMKNLTEEEYLYWYRRNVTPILNREKTNHKEINNKVVVNIAEEIVSFKDGYFLTQPANYVSRTEGKEDEVRELNEYLYRSGKHSVDNEIVDWFHTVGKGVLFVAPNNDDEVPVEVYTLDPRSAFVVYSLAPGAKPVFAVNFVDDGDRTLIDVYTYNRVFRMQGVAKAAFYDEERPIESLATNVIDESANPLGDIPIIEYIGNSMRMGAFEQVISLIDSLSLITSNRCDGIEQFIQSIAVAVNCDFDDDVKADDIRKAGMICLKSNDGNKADFTILSEQLDQSQTQTLIDDLYDRILSICGMPSTTKGGTSTSDTGTAVLARDGWYQADTYARNTEDLFIKSNRLFDRIFLNILKRKKGIDLTLNDFELSIVRNETANIQSKAQAYTTLVNGGFHPVLAMKKSGVSNDPNADFEFSKEYMNMKVGDPSAEEEELELETDAMGRTEPSEDEPSDGEPTADGSEETEE